MHISKKLILSGALSLGVLAVGACGDGRHVPCCPATTSPGEYVLVQDSFGKGSAQEPRLTMDDVKSFVDSALKRRGGDFSVIVDSASSDPMAQLHIDPPPPQCVKTGRDFDDATCARQYKKSYQTWETATNQQVAQFMTTLGPMLTAVGQNDRDVWSALSQADLVLGEPQPSGVTAPQKALILVSTRDTRNQLCKDVFQQRTIPAGTTTSSSLGGEAVCCFGEYYDVVALSPTSPCSEPPKAPATTAVDVFGPMRSAGVQFVVVKDSTNLSVLDEFHPAPFGSVAKAFEFVANPPPPTRASAGG